MATFDVLCMIKWTFWRIPGQ